MLVTFSSPAHGDVTLFGDVALRLLAMMGRSDKVPSSLYAEDVQAALDRLKAAVASTPASPTPNTSADYDEDDEDEAPVSIAHRALPLIELLEAAAKEKSVVMWESNR
jgi:hypothetical protein